MTLTEFLAQYDFGPADREQVDTITAAWAAATERAAGVADKATIGLTGFAESDRMEFCVKNLSKLREHIAAAIRGEG